MATPFASLYTPNVGDTREREGEDVPTLVQGRLAGVLTVGLILRVAVAGLPPALVLEHH